MKNNYLLEGETSFDITKEIERIIKKQDFSTAIISHYDLVEETLEVALEDLDTYGFLSEKKVIIIHGLESINQEDNKKEIEHLYKYLDNSNPDNLLFIVANKWNNTLKLTKELKKKMEYILISKDPIKFVKDSFKEYKISSSLIEYLVNKCLGDTARLENECNKLKTYKYDTKEINKEDIDELVVQKLGDSTDLTFSFNRSLAQKDKKAALEKYYELLKYNIEPLSVIGLLASQIRIIYQVKVLEKQRLSSNDIATTLGEKNSYRVKKTQELTKYYTEKELLDLMQQLADMDLKIKTTDVDPNSLIELFIISM